jgi:hypothetical protein
MENNPPNKTVSSIRQSRVASNQRIPYDKNSQDKILLSEIIIMIDVQYPIDEMTILLKKHGLD